MTQQSQNPFFDYFKNMNEHPLNWMKNNNTMFDQNNINNMNKRAMETATSASHAIASSMQATFSRMTEMAWNATNDAMNVLKNCTGNDLQTMQKEVVDYCRKTLDKTANYCKEINNAVLNSVNEVIDLSCKAANQNLAEANQTKKANS